MRVVLGSQSRRNSSLPKFQANFFLRNKDKKVFSFFNFGKFIKLYESSRIEPFNYNKKLTKIFWITVWVLHVKTTVPTDSCKTIETQNCSSPPGWRSPYLRAKNWGSLSRLLSSLAWSPAGRVLPALLCSGSQTLPFFPCLLWCSPMHQLCSPTGSSCIGHKWTRYQAFRFNFNFSFWLCQLQATQAHGRFLVKATRRKETMNNLSYLLLLNCAWISLSLVTRVMLRLWTNFTNAGAFCLDVWPLSKSPDGFPPMWSWSSLKRLASKSGFHPIKKKIHYNLEMQYEEAFLTNFMRYCKSSRSLCWEWKEQSVLRDIVTVFTHHSLQEQWCHPWLSSWKSFEKCFWGAPMT